MTESETTLRASGVSLPSVYEPAGGAGPVRPMFSLYFTTPEWKDPALEGTILPPTFKWVNHPSLNMNHGAFRARSLRRPEVRLAPVLERDARREVRALVEKLEELRARNLPGDALFAEWPVGSVTVTPFDFEGPKGPGRSLFLNSVTLEPCPFLRG